MIRLLSTSDASVSTSVAQTFSTPSSGALPAKTAKRAKTSRSSGSSSPEDQRDRGTEGLLPWVRVPAALQQVEAVAQPVEDLLGCQDCAPSRCELEREREIVEALAQLQDGRARLEGRVEGSSTGGEEVETFRSRQLRDRIHVFAREPEPLTARDHELWAVEVS